MTDTFGWFLGVDWGSQAHEVVLLDQTGRIRGRRTVAHTAAAVHEAVTWVQTTTGVAPAAVAVAIETPRGILVDTFLELGFSVFALNPKQLDRFRDRFSAAGAKDDRRDAHVLGDALRTDSRAFHAVRPDAPLLIELREVTRLREDLAADERRFANRLRDQLCRVDAPWLQISPAADEPWLWTLLRQVPEPERWSQLTQKRVAAILRGHRIRRFSADEVLQAVRQPRLPSAPGVTKAVTTRITTLVKQLQLVHAERLAAEQQIEQLLEAMAENDAEGDPRVQRDVAILRSLPGAGRIVTATMLTEATSALAARDYALLRAHAGTAPVTRRSGKRGFLVHMRRACKRRLRDVLYHWARTSLQHDGPAHAYYARLRAQGHTHARALRSVGDRWLRILIAMLRSGQTYDASRLLRIEAVAG